MYWATVRNKEVADIFESWLALEKEEGVADIFVPQLQIIHTQLLHRIRTSPQSIKEIGAFHLGERKGSEDICEQGSEDIANN